MSGHGRLTSTGPRARPLSHDPEGARAPVRTCVGCRERDLRSVLLRLVLDRSGAPSDGPRLVVDARRSMPGRGAWLHATWHCLDLAERRRAFVRALHGTGPLDTRALHEHIERVAGGR